MNTEWNTTEPPKDGSPIVAIGKVVYTDGCFTSCDSFLAEISWHQPEGGHLGWHYPTGMSVALTLKDEVIIHFWMPYPKTEASVTLDPIGGSR